jgi:hypothetical protein
MVAALQERRISSVFGQMATVRDRRHIKTTRFLEMMVGWSRGMAPTLLPIQSAACTMARPYFDDGQVH